MRFDRSCAPYMDLRGPPRVAGWCKGYDAGLATHMVVARLPAVPISGNNLRQVVHTHVPPLSPSSINWHRSNGDDGKVTVGLASHWLCVTDFSGLTTHGLNGL